MTASSAPGADTPALLRPFRLIGRSVLAALREVGRISTFSARVLAACLSPPIYVREFLRQCLRIGFYSLPVVGLTAIFIGAALALNIYTGGSRFNAEQFVPNIVVLGITRELGPTLAGLMLAGRVSAGIAAEIGAMRVTEQIDALLTLSTRPERYLYAPRVLAATLTLPVMVVIADIIGVMGGWLVAVSALDFNGDTYLRNTWGFVTAGDIWSGVIKAAVFGAIISLMGCYQGDRSKGGAGGVGRAATLAVVGAAVLILASNYILTSIFVKIGLSAMAPILELRNVHKRFGGKEVLRGVELAVAPGQSLVIIGGSGTGKSVTIKCALGLMMPEQGEILFDGQPVTSNRSVDALRRRTGMLFQGGALFDSLTVWENVAFALMQRDRVGRGEARKRAIETLTKVRLGPSAADLRPAELSGGMQKRVGLARAIIASPDLIFFDEPTTGLDPITADAVNNLIVEQVKALGAAAITITHDMASVRKIADAVAMLHEGRIIWRGPISKLDSSGSPHVEQFVHGKAEGPIQPAI